MRRRKNRFISALENLLLPRLNKRNLKASKLKKKTKQNRFDSFDITLQEESWKDKKRRYHFFDKYQKHLTNQDLISQKIKQRVNKKTIPVNKTNSTISSYVIDKSISFKNVITSSPKMKILCEAPWTNINDYPTIPEIHTCGIGIYKENMETLLPDKWLDDNVINSFFYKQEDLARKNGLKLIVFDTFLTIKLENTNASLKKWAINQQIFNFDFWLIPYNLRGNHWVLFLVNFIDKKIIYFDSLHGAAPLPFVTKLLNFTSYLSINIKNIHISWNSWTIYSPSDIPTQRIRGKIGSNCGPHVCTWAYIIASQVPHDFNEHDMPAIRKWILSELLAIEMTREKIKKT